MALKRLLYRILMKLVPFSFNTLNALLGGNLPPLGTICVIVEEQGRFLVIRRYNGQLVFPGGFMRWRENPMQTAEREFREETGMNVRVLEAVGTYSSISTGISRMSTLTVAFPGELLGGELRGSIEGMPLWMEEAELREGLTTRYVNMLRDYQAFGRRHLQTVQADSLPPTSNGEPA